MSEPALGPHHARTIADRLSLIEFLVRRARLAEARDRLDDLDRALDAAGRDIGDPLRQGAERARTAAAS